MDGCSLAEPRPQILQATRNPALTDSGHLIPAIPDGHPLIEFVRVEKRYGSLRALADVSLHINQGSVLALLGPNGAGKSTLFGCLLGLTRPTTGTIKICGRPRDDADPASVGYVAERVALYPNRTVGENGSFFARLKGQSEAEFHGQLHRVGLAGVENRLVRQLSKGMLQRVGLAIALCGRPQRLVLDEPFNGLDPAILEDLQLILREERARGATLLISTHTISAVESLATHVAILVDGRLEASAGIEDLRAAHPQLSLEQIYHLVAREARARRETANS